MKYVFLVFCLCVPMIVLAYVSPIAVPETPQTVLPLGEVSRAHEYFGRLDDFPHAYSFEVRQEQPYTISVSIPDEPQYTNDVSLILVKAEKRGVSEMGRTNPKESSWNSEKSVLYATSFRKGGTLAGTLVPGSYILEVSSPNNDGKYRLYFGSESVGRGYIGNVRALLEVHAFLGYNKLQTLLSPLLYIPLIVLCSAGTLWYMRKRRVLRI